MSSTKGCSKRRQPSAARSGRVESLEARLLLAAQPYAWQNVNIGAGGFVDGVFFDPANANVIYARTDIGGLYKTTNGGGGDATRWQELLDFTNNNTSNDYQQMGVLAFAMDPRNTSKIYLTAGMYSNRNGWLMRSGDGGQTFNQINLPFYVGGNSNGRATGERLAVDPNLGSILFVGSNDHGLYKSVDGGASVTAVSSFPLASADIDFVTIDPTSAAAGSASQTIYVGIDSTAAGSNIYRSTNGGTTWSLLAGGGPSGLVPMRGVYASNGYLYFTFSNDLPPSGNLTTGGVWRYQISSGAWTNISPQTPGGSNPTFGYDGIAVDPSNPSAVVVTSFDRYSGPDTIWRTANAPAATPTWVQLFDPSSALNFGYGGYNTTRDTSTAPWIAAFGDGIGNWAAAVAIDPFNSAHLLYTTGQGIWATDHGNSATKLTAANSWYFPDTGIEFTAVGSVAAPASGVPLYSAMGDIGGFAHTTLTQSPAQGAAVGGSGYDVDFAGTNPNDVAIVGGIGSTNGAYSTNGGASFTTFAASPASAFAGSIAVTASGSTTTMVWAPSGQAAYWSTDHGATWTASTGALPTGGTVIADRVNPGDFYYYWENAADNQLSVYISTDGGVSFSLASTTATGNCQLVASPYTAGDLWLTSYSGLWHSTNFGSSFAFGAGAGVQWASLMALGKAAPSQSYAALYIWGQIGGVVGVYRSDDKGSTWALLNDAAHQWGGLSQTMAADPNVFGRVYIGFNGRGIIMGNPASALPAGWTDADINAPGNPGWATSATTLSNNTVVNQWTVDGGGVGVAGSSDQFHFTYKNVAGDYAVVAQLKSLNNAGGGTPQAGVMFRGGAGASDAFAAVLQTTGNQLVFEYRTVGGGAIGSTSLGSVPIGAEYLEVRRAGATFAALYSGDGSHWTQLGSNISIATMPATANAGLAVTANDNAQLSSATFSNVQVAATSAISGNVFVDNNGNGAPDAGELALAGITIFIDANNNGVLDAGETSTTSTAGGYSFTGLLPGTYTVRQVVPAGYVQSGPNRGANPAGAFSVSAAGATYAGNNFGVFPIAYAGSGGNDSYYVRLNASGTNLEIDLSSTPLATPSFTIAKSLVPSLTFDLGGGDDTVTVDYANGNPVPAGVLSVNGGTGSDSLAVLGGPGNDGVTIGASTVSVNGSTVFYTNLDSLQFDAGGGSDTITQSAQPSAALSITGAGSNDTLNVNGGTFAFAAGAGGSGSNVMQWAAVSVAAGASVTVAPAAFAGAPKVLDSGSLTLASGSTLDLGNNEVLTTTVADMVRMYIVTGRMLTSTPGGGVGYLDLGGGETEARYTLLGDTNLDGTVDVTDLGNLASSYGSASGATWVMGDADYNGAVDVTDLGDLASSYGASLATPPAAPAAPSAVIAGMKSAAREPAASSWFLPATRLDELTVQRVIDLLNVVPTP